MGHAQNLICPTVKTQKNAQGKSTLIATLGVEPQVVTITLDKLLSAGEKIGECIVVYTGTPGVLQALSLVEEEFLNFYYRETKLTPVLVETSSGAVKDFCTEEDLRALLRTLYREVRRARQSGGKVHLCVSGGRKVMGIMGMVVAQLLFGPEDRVWHLVTEGWQPGNERQLHLPPEKEVWLVPVPVLRWSESGTLIHLAAELDDPAEVVAWYEKLSADRRQKRQREFVERWLTRAEREVVRLVCRGLDNASIAKALGKSEQTVANQLSGVYEKLREWLGFLETGPDRRSRLIAEFAPYFVLTEEGKRR